MSPIEQYRRFGLRQPITFRPGLRTHLFLWGGGSFLIFGCFVAMNVGSPFEKAVGAFGLLFFGVAFAILIYAIAKSRSRGLCEISDQGIYMSHIGTTLPWKDIGPAWCSITKHQGGKTKDVVFVLRNASRHTARMNSLGRALMSLSKRAVHSSAGGGLDWGMRAFTTVAEADETYDQFAIEMDRIRRAVEDEPDSTVFNIPAPLRFGVPVDDLITIINREVALRNSRKTPSESKQTALSPSADEKRLDCYKQQSKLARYMLLFWPRSVTGWIARIVFIPALILEMYDLIFIIDRIGRGSLGIDHIVPLMVYTLVTVLSYLLAVYDGRVRRPAS